jgi:hypothetical protein
MMDISSSETRAGQQLFNDFGITLSGKLNQFAKRVDITKRLDQHDASTIPLTRALPLAHRG